MAHMQIICMSGTTSSGESKRRMPTGRFQPVFFSPRKSCRN
jgi:hypothetical protein